MREHKFRAWYENKMHRVTSFHVGTGMVTIPLMRFPFTQDVIPDAIVEYTGLKDKNGKEIYESDIVMFGQTPCSVRWSDDLLRWMLDAVKDKVIYEEKFILNGRTEVEVIGNIYENPKLL